MRNKILYENIAYKFIDKLKRQFKLIRKIRKNSYIYIKYMTNKIFNL